MSVKFMCIPIYQPCQWCRWPSLLVGQLDTNLLPRVRVLVGQVDGHPDLPEVPMVSIVSMQYQWPSLLLGQVDGKMLPSSCQSSSCASRFTSSVNGVNGRACLLVRLMLICCPESQPRSTISVLVSQDNGELFITVHTDLHQ